MPKVKISEYSATANSNTDVASINIDEGCAPSGINNAIRAVMGHLKDFQQGTNGDPFNGPVNGTLGATTASTANVTTLTTSSTVTHNGGTINGVAYLNGAKVLTTGSALTFDGTNLGVGITPTTKLHVSSATNTFATVESTNGAAYWQMIGNNATNASYNALISKYGATTDWSISGGNGTTGQMLFNIGGTEGFRLTSTSLYTASGIDLLVGSTSSFGVVNGEISVKAASGGAGVALWDAGVSSKFQLIAGAGGVNAFGLYDISASAYRWTVDSSGNLLVGTSNSSGTIGAGFKVLGGRPVVVNADSANTTTVYEAYSTGASAYRFYVGMGGTIFATSIVITAISDQRLKENVRDIDTGLNSIMALKPRRFDWKEGKGQDKKNVAGFIAQEFEDVFPECVTTSKAGADGIEYKNINHETLIPTLVKAMQEQQALISQLTDRITALEGA